VGPLNRVQITRNLISTDISHIDSILPYHTSEFLKMKIYLYTTYEIMKGFMGPQKSCTNDLKFLFTLYFAYSQLFIIPHK